MDSGARLAHGSPAHHKGETMSRIGIYGSAGRMGRAIQQAIAAAGATLAGGIDAEGDAAALAKASDVLVDFSVPGALVDHLSAAVAAGTPLVIGTTGIGPEHHQAIDDAAHHIAVLQTGNTSLGVTLLAALVKQAAARLGPDWDIELVEMHHRHKADAPSGTSLLLGAAAAAGRGIDLSTQSDRGRDGITGPREEGRIGFAALRGGSVAGDHMVIFAGEGERIELGHRAETREIFARGAVKAALWLAGRPAGRYRMEDVLGL